MGSGATEEGRIRFTASPAHPLVGLRSAGLFAASLLASGLLAATPTGAQDPGVSPAQGRALAPDAFLDPVARSLYLAAATNWRTLDESVLRYTARIEQRIAAAIRTPLKDRVIYRNETAVRAFWDHDYESVVQVLGTRSRYPGRNRAFQEGELDWLEDLPFDAPFEPGGDRLLFGMTDQDEAPFQPTDDAFWLAHPLTDGADSLYRFQSGDTLTLSLPDGRGLSAVRLDVLPREADAHRISGALWIEPRSGALVRAAFRLSRQFDAVRDVPELQEEEARGTFRYVPGLFKPWTFDLTMVAVDYGLWDFEVWLPRSMRVEGEAAAGILKFPVSMDLAYHIESVTTAADSAPRAEASSSDLREVHFATRAEAMAFVARLLSGEEDVAYEVMHDAEEAARGRESLLIVPKEREKVAESPHLPPPIWESAPGFPSDDALEEYLRSLADLPAPQVTGIPWAFNWGWARPDLVRYNRVEGLAAGGRFQASVGGPYAVGVSGFFGLADLRPKARLTLERATVLRRLSLGAYHELQATNPRGGYLGFGNSLDALFFGRDNGEYYRATGADLTWRPPSGARESFLFRAYGERHDRVEAETDFALFRVFDGDWKFRSNVPADPVDEAGAELRLLPWWGHDPEQVQLGVELYGRSALWRPARTGEDTRSTYGQASIVVRTVFPVAGTAWGSWRLGVEAGGGTTWGEAPVQRSWFLGASTLRGYPASVRAGLSFLRGRIEVARSWDGAGVSLFGDTGWAGSRSSFDADDLLFGVGVGGSILDGLIRMDISHGLKGPDKQFRIDLYLDAIM